MALFDVSRPVVAGHGFGAAFNSFFAGLKDAVERVK